MDDSLTIQSFNGAYTARFCQSVADAVAGIPRECPMHIIVDPHVVDLHETGLKQLLQDARSVQQIEASEENKSLELTPQLIKRLSKAGIRRDHLLVGVGGGIIQDLTCFVASILFRGMDWVFLPTTLLAQADSCIGSKSSINAAGTKNLVGNFYPPRQIFIAAEFLTTLSTRDVRSGIGEMLKVHIIDGPASYDRIAAAYESLFTDRNVILSFIRHSLLLKKRLIELDEFDRGPRNVMNYGHSFGHAIEAATNFVMPHGVAVTMGMDMANHVARSMGRLQELDFRRMHLVLRKNYIGYEDLAIPLPQVLDSLSRDKKNVGADLVLILPDEQVHIEKVRIPADATFQDICRDFLDNVRRSA